ncbi:MAG: HEAT repeat domain-containing protein [Chlamydiales bacterium]|nr:HEAT repeat domain-containing protein [Chlamydiales bacterium]
MLTIAILAGSYVFSNELQLANQIESHLTISDYTTALVNAKKALELYPDSLLIKTLLIKSLAKNEEMDKALTILNSLDKEWDKKDNQYIPLIETICWGILSKPQDNFEHLQMIHLIGASTTHDYKGVQILLRCLKSTNALIRAQAIKITPTYRDDILQQEILHLLKKEKNWFVKLELIKAVGAMQMKEAKPWLKEILEDTKYTHEEKALAIQSLVTIYEQINVEELQTLLNSPRSGLRELGVMLITHLKQPGLLSYCSKLLLDSSPYVRIAAIHAYALLNSFSYEEEILAGMKKLLLDDHPIVSLSAAWALTPYSPHLTKQVFEEKINSPHPEIRWLCATIISRQLSYFSDFANDILFHHEDDLVKINIALGCIKHRIFLKEGGECIANFLERSSSYLMTDSFTHPFFDFIGDNQSRHLPHIPDYPKLINGLTRIALIRDLFIVEHKKSLALLKDYFLHHLWGLTFESSITLLQEGDFQSIENLERLLQDENPKVRVQTALALAFVSKDNTVVPLLINAYKELDSNIQLSMLEALGYIGSKEAIEFLIARLQDPFQLTRVVAASSIIQSIYH